MWKSGATWCWWFEVKFDVGRCMGVLPYIIFYIKLDCSLLHMYAYILRRCKRVNLMIHNT